VPLRRRYSCTGSTVALPIGNSSVTLVPSARMRYMVIETFTQGARPVYERARDRGRMLPEGLAYLESWVEEGGGRCFQLMESDDPALFDRWTPQWDDLADFEIVPVMGSADAARRALE
jgi:Protein of unknown function (DUF3303)